MILPEKELLDYIARGLANAEIAQMTGIAEKTVRNHITTIFSKLAVEHRAQAIVVGLGFQTCRTLRLLSL